jgi:hypothetical protein
LSLGDYGTKFRNWKKLVLGEELEDYLEDQVSGSVEDPFYDFFNEINYAKHADLPKGFGRD